MLEMEWRPPKLFRVQLSSEWCSTEYCICNSYLGVLSNGKQPALHRGSQGSFGLYGSDQGSDQKRRLPVVFHGVYFGALKLPAGKTSAVRGPHGPNTQVTELEWLKHSRNLWLWWWLLAHSHVLLSRSNSVHRCSLKIIYRASKWCEAGAVWFWAVHWTIA